ncbi:MAG: hypothetical protein ACFE0O_07355 [Opitutales bacterium]
MPASRIPRRSRPLALYSLALGILLGAGPLAGQNSRGELPSFTLAAVQLGDFELPTFYVRDTAATGRPGLEPTYTELRIAVNTRGRPTAIPLAGRAALYREQTDNDGESVMAPAIEIPVNRPGDTLLLVFHRDLNGKTRHAFLDDSADAHPPKTVRLANFSDHRVAFRVGGEPVLVQPGEAEVAEPEMNGNVRFSFKHYAPRTSGRVYESPGKLLRFRQETSRLLVLYTAMPFGLTARESGGGPAGSGESHFRPVAYRLYDTVDSRR